MQAFLQILDPLLGCAAIHVPVVEGSGRSGRVVTTKRVFGALVEGFGFVDDPALPVPGVGLVGGLADQAHLLAGLRALRAGLGEQRRGQRLQAACWGSGQSCR